MNMPPPDAGQPMAEAGWYPDSVTPGMMRWWDGAEWSETDIRMAGEEVYPLWHPACWNPGSLLTPLLHRTRFGSFIAHVLSLLGRNGPWRA